jgi:hypothetical protein
MPAANISEGCVTIKLEVAGENERHEHVFAQDAMREDPARRIAFAVTGTAHGGQLLTFYPNVAGDKAVFRVNALAD